MRDERRTYFPRVDWDVHAGTLASLARAGATSGQIAKYIGCTENAVELAAARLGVAISRTPAKARDSRFTPLPQEDVPRNRDRDFLCLILAAGGYQNAHIRERAGA